MFRGMRKTRKMKVMWYAVSMIDLNEYLDTFTGSKASKKMGETELNKILLHIITSGWSRKA